MSRLRPRVKRRDSWRCALAAEPRPDAEVASDVLLEPVRAEHALADVADPVGDALGAGVLDVDPELDPLQAEVVEAPFAQQPKRTGRDPAAPRSRAQDIADLALTRLPLDLDDHPEPEELAVVGLDGEP